MFILLISLTAIFCSAIHGGDDNGTTGIWNGTETTGIQNYTILHLNGEFHPCGKKSESPVNHKIQDKRGFAYISMYIKEWNSIAPYGEVSVKVLAEHSMNCKNPACMAMKNYLKNGYRLWKTIIHPTEEYTFVFHEEKQ